MGAWNPFLCGLLIVLLCVHESSCFYDPHCNGKTVIVHLFEWRWSSIAAECESFLADAGYCGVQVRILPIIDYNCFGSIYVSRCPLQMNMSYCLRTAIHGGRDINQSPTSLTPGQSIIIQSNIGLINHNFFLFCQVWF